jgi:hypothetical protein
MVSYCGVLLKFHFYLSMTYSRDNCIRLHSHVDYGMLIYHAALLVLLNLLELRRSVRQFDKGVSSAVGEEDGAHRMH